MCLQFCVQLQTAFKKSVIRPTIKSINNNNLLLIDQMLPNWRLILDNGTFVETLVFVIIFNYLVAIIIYEHII